MIKQATILSAALIVSGCTLAPANGGPPVRNTFMQTLIVTS